SDRIAAIEDLLRAAGVAARWTGVALEVTGSPAAAPAVLPTRADHRIVMAAALLAFARGGWVETPRAVEKSYPRFFRDAFGI
ncbi:MAG TPA: 3-phosphoshikimate 1-carboxyvinyltransferase, partial [Thermoanaerobaculia bacterium]|nr:3-phosphoshikimate 1-carboxyvinyltransferase [Thermoanaerobaculia bacterium]